MLAWWQSDLMLSLRRSPVALGSALVALACLVMAVFAEWLAPTNPFDLNALELANARLPPSWSEGGQPGFLLGTDEQGRDILSALMYGARISMVVAGVSVLASALIGIALGLLAGYRGGWVDALLMRLCDVMLSFPAFLLALMLAGVAHALFPQASLLVTFGVLIVSITLAGWVPYARTVRGQAMVERHKEYVLAARVTGVPGHRIMWRHVLPNVMQPVFVLATLQVAQAIIIEATLSFLGVGVPPTSPSLGTLIRIGNNYLLSGEWWITLFPGLMLVAISLSINLLGDWLRDALNPRLH
ncbi:MAG: ABC transporter permease [Burkholderiales bacterium]|nr:ABC transporter permease [Burkholderiales bacterium]